MIYPNEAPYLRGHVPDVTWYCTEVSCRPHALEWPCPEARALLLTEFSGRPSDLAIQMWQWMEWAAAVLPDHPHDPLSQQLWRRFIGWTPGTARVPVLSNRATPQLEGDPR